MVTAFRVRTCAQALPRLLPAAHAWPRTTNLAVRRCTSSKMAAADGGDWRDNLVTSPEEVAQLVRSFKRIAVLGIKTEKQADQPAFYVAEYLHRSGLDVVPVPVYYPDVKEILGKPVVRRVQDVAGPLDCVDVFRRPADVTGHVEDILVAAPKCVWLQSGITNAAAEETFARAGIKVVSDRCLLVEHRRAVPGGRL